MVRTTAGRVRMWVLFMAVITVAGCGDEDPTGLTPEALAGTWTAREATVTNLADASESEDLMAQGLVFTLTLGADGSVTSSIQLGPIDDTDSGTYTITGNELSMTLDGDPVSGTIAGGGDVLDVVIDEGVEWDFGSNGIEVPARLEVEFVRTS